MPTLLQINSSLFGELGHSSLLTQAFADGWLKSNPRGHLIRRDLSVSELPQFDAQCARAFRGQALDLNTQQRSALALSDELIAEFKQADAVVLGVPMYNFNVPSQLKVYLDYLARASVTFRYTANGPIGLLPPVPVYIMTARGGVHVGTESDAQTPFLKTYLEFLGLREIYFVYAEGLNVDQQRREMGMSQAFARIRELTAEAK
jgi:FMN-dependent NADH-azoreductase